LTKKETLIGIILILFLGGIGLKKYLNTPKGKLNFHRFILKLPLVGELIRKVALANFSRTFATLMRSGVSIVQGLDIVAKTSGNKVIEEAVLKSKKFIQQGQPIYLPLEESGAFPPMVVKMIAVGERSGRLEGMLLKIAQFYEEQTDAMVAGLSSLIEPIIIVFLGVVVGGIVVALFLPILKITQYLGGV
jgi:type IV pilus assembly protein PilC